MRFSSLHESTKMALRSIRTNSIRSFLTALGVMIGVAAVIALVALGNGAQESVEASLQNLGTNLMLVYSGEPKGGSLVRRNTTNIKPTLTQEDLADIRELIPGAVIRAAPETSANAQIKYGNVNQNITLVGTEPDYPYIRNYQPVYGDFFTTADQDSRKTQVVLGAEVYRNLFPEASDPVGLKVRINGIGFTVTGIMQEKGDSSLDNGVYIPISTFQRYISGEDEYAILNIQAAELETMDTLQDYIESLILENHGIINMETADFYIANQLDLLSTVQGVAETFTILLASIAAISLLVGGIGIMNIMLVSVTERTREIGVRMAMGAKSRDILSQFMIEAVIISLLGGGIGIILGLGAAWASVNLWGMAAVASLDSVAMAFGFALAIGLFFGGYPAWRASTLDPIEALRFE